MALENEQIPASVLGDDIVDVRPLGKKGGFSRLFRAHKQGLDVDVVIKRVKRAYSGQIDEEAEARILTALRHQYLPRIYDLKYGPDGFVYTIMEYISGNTLSEYVAEHGALDQRTAIRWTRQLCEVVKYMHSRKPNGIIHSDLKPENIIITPDQNICVIDFNASLETAENGQELTAIGVTNGYAAPEQYNVSLKGVSKTSPYYRYVKAAQHYGKVTFRTDIYAIGAVSYFMLTGYTPNIWLDGVIPLNRFELTVGDGYRYCIEKAMEPNPKKRFASAEEMYDTLTKKIAVFDQSYKRLNRQRLAAITGVSLGILCGIALILLGLQKRNTEDLQQYRSLVAEARDLQDNGDYQASREKLEEAISQQEHTPDAYIALASLLYERGSYREAIQLLDGTQFEKNAAESQDNFSADMGEIYNIEGSCYYRLEDYPAAREQYQLAVNLIPDEPDYLRDLAICYIRTGDTDKAEDSLKKMEDLDADPTSISYIQGELELSNQDYQKAYDELKETAENTKDEELKERAYLDAASCLDELYPESKTEKIEFLTDALKNSSTEHSADIRIQLAQSLEAEASDTGDTDQLEKAIEVYQPLYDAGLMNLDTKIDYANLFWNLKEYDKEEEILGQLDTEDNADYRVPMMRAEIFLEQNDTSQFEECMSRAEALYQNSGETNSRMEKLLEKYNGGNS